MSLWTKKLIDEICLERSTAICENQFASSNRARSIGKTLDLIRSSPRSCRKDASTDDRERKKERIRDRERARARARERECRSRSGNESRRPENIGGATSKRESRAIRPPALPARLKNRARGYRAPCRPRTFRVPSCRLRAASRLSVHGNRSQAPCGIRDHRCATAGQKDREKKREKENRVRLTPSPNLRHSS